MYGISPDVAFVGNEDHMNKKNLYSKTRRKKISKRIILGVWQRKRNKKEQEQDEEKKRNTHKMLIMYR